jgi:probable HAF family extracellular repeat protein
MGILLLIVGSLAATAATLFAQRPTAQGYSITDLGSLGGTSSEAAGVNNLGDVVGASTTATAVSHAFLYRNGLMFDLGTLPGGSASYATAINDRGEIVGFSGINAYGPQFRERTQGFAWVDGTMHALGALYCRCSFNVRYGTSRALAIANGGQIVGDSETDRGESFRHAFLWQDNGMRDLGAEVDGAGNSYADGINDINEIVGTVNGRAFLARDGLSQELGVLPGHTASDARAINNKGQVAGNSVTADGISHAFLWNLGTMRNLGTLPGDISSQAQALNVGGDVVGRSGVADLSASRAVIWQGGPAIDLNRLITSSGWILSSATGINDRGQIVGVGLRNGEVRAFLLNPR